LDAKVNVPHSESKLPDEKRIKGEHIAKYAESLASDVEEYQSTWSGYLKQEIKPETLPKHFEQVKKQMVEAFQSRGKKN
jgi:large subunit ribosomal protein L18